MLKNDSFLAWILDGFRPRFGGIFGWFFGPHMHENCKNTILAKPLKIAIFPRENLYFQGFDVFRFRKKMLKSPQKSNVFWDIDFGWILGGFGEGFGRPKSSIFAFFSMFFRCHFSSAVRKAKKSTKNVKKTNFSAFWRRVCGGPPPPGERKG